MSFSEAISQYLSIIGLTLQVGGFVSKFFSPDGVASSADIANYGADVDFWFKR